MFSYEVKGMSPQVFVSLILTGMFIATIAIGLGFRYAA
jgi:hypothetical protein